jgi:ABC-type dipeptide/oligopeptide/nickel transport system permease subunit
MATVATPYSQEYAAGTLAREQVSLWKDGVRRLRRNKLAWGAFFYLSLLTLMAVIAFFWTPYNPSKIGVCETFGTPTLGHPFGCDQLGRDSLSRLMQGAQVSLAVGLGTAFIVLLVTT